MRDLDRSVRQELRTLSKDNAAGVAEHLVMVARLLDADLDAATAHAQEAVRRAGRVAAVREARGTVAYRAGDYQLALAEFRTARRLSGSNALLPLMVDCERGLGRLERALELAESAEARTLPLSERVELAIVVSGIRRELGQHEAAQLVLQGSELDPSRRMPWSARLFYAYAEALKDVGDDEGARAWFAHAAEADDVLQTDAAERLEEIDGVVLVDLLEGEDDSDDDGPDAASGRASDGENTDDDHGDDRGLAEGRSGDHAGDRADREAGLDEAAVDSSEGDAEDPDEGDLAAVDEASSATAASGAGLSADDGEPDSAEAPAADAAEGDVVAAEDRTELISTSDDAAGDSGSGEHAPAADEPPSPAQADDADHPRPTADETGAEVPAEEDR